MSLNILLSLLNPTFLFYTDPGSGALLLQLITATLLGGLFYSRKIKDWFFRKKSPQEDSSKIKSKHIKETIEQ